MQRIWRIAILGLWLAGPALADSEEVCVVAAARETYAQMMAHDRAGRAREAWNSAYSIDSQCITQDEAERARIWGETVAVLTRASAALGAAAEKNGKLSEAYDYYQGFHPLDADRMQLQLSRSKPRDLENVQRGLGYFRRLQENLQRDAAPVGENELARARLGALHRERSQESVDAMDPQREKRLRTVRQQLAELEALVVENGDRFLAEEEAVFSARKTSVTARSDSLEELGHARSWLDLVGRGERADERAVKRGDSLLTHDTRNSIELGLAYYGFASDEQRVASARRKAERLGDVHLQKGEKALAAGYYELAGLGDKATELREADEAQKEEAETERQQKFQDEQSALERELGF